MLDSICWIFCLATPSFNNGSSFAISYRIKPIHTLQSIHSLMADITAKLVFYRLRETLLKLKDILTSHDSSHIYGPDVSVTSAIGNRDRGKHSGLSAGSRSSGNSHFQGHNSYQQTPRGIRNPLTSRIKNAPYPTSSTTPIFFSNAGMLKHLDLLDLLLAFWILFAVLLALLACFVNRFFFKHSTSKEGGNDDDGIDGKRNGGPSKRSSRSLVNRFLNFSSSSNERSFTKPIKNRKGSYQDLLTEEGFVVVSPSEWSINIKKWLDSNGSSSPFAVYLKSHVLNSLNQRARMSKDNVQITFEDILDSPSKEAHSRTKINHLLSEPSSTKGIKIVDDIELNDIPMKVFATERFGETTNRAMFDVFCKVLHGQLRILVYPIQNDSHATVTFDSPPDMDLEISQTDGTVVPNNLNATNEDIIDNNRLNSLNRSSASPLSSKFDSSKSSKPTKARGPQIGPTIDIEILDRIIREAISTFQVTLDLSRFRGPEPMDNRAPFPLPYLPSLPEATRKSDLDEDGPKQSISKSQQLSSKYRDRNETDNLNIPSYYVPREDGRYTPSSDFYSSSGQSPRPFTPDYDGTKSNVSSSHRDIYSVPNKFRRSSAIPKQLFVKIVKANGLGDIIGCQDPYCTVSLIETTSSDDHDASLNYETSQTHTMQPHQQPQQKYMTSVMKNTANPFWDENFLFDLWPEKSFPVDGNLEEQYSVFNDCERWPTLKMEIYDRSKKVGDDFLGQATVPVLTLVSNPNQRQIIPLLSRSDRTDSVSGAITVEFLLLDSNGNPLNDLRFQSTAIPPTSKRYSDLKNFKPSNLSLPPTNVSQHLINSTTTQPVGLKKTANKNEDTFEIPNKYTCLHITGIIKNIRDGKIYAVEEVDGKIMPSDTVKETFIPQTSSIFTSLRRSISSSRTKRGGRSTSRNTRIKSPLTPTTYRSQSAEPNSSSAAPPNIKTAVPLAVVDRTKSASHTHLPITAGGGEYAQIGGSNKTLGGARIVTTDDATKRSPSVSTTQHGGYLDVPKQQGGTISDGGSIHSRYSSATYLVDNSITVLQTKFGNITRYLILPDSYIANECLKLKGEKLHVFNDHAFSAQKTSGNEICDVCGRQIGLHIGRGAYICRDCGAIVHKGCHDKFEKRCPTAKIISCEMIYVMPQKDFY